MSSASDWKIYRTRFLIKARQLDAPLAFTDPLGREHHGLKGDYLVESSDGLQRIAPREIFEDIYVPMGIAEDPRLSPTHFEIDAPVSSSRSVMIQSSDLHPTATPPIFRTDTVAGADSVLPLSSPARRTRRDSMRSATAAIVPSASNLRLDYKARSNPASRRGARLPSGSGSSAPSAGACTQVTVAAARSGRFAPLSPRRTSAGLVRNYRGENASS